MSHFKIYIINWSLGLHDMMVTMVVSTSNIETVRMSHLIIMCE